MVDFSNPKFPLSYEIYKKQWSSPDNVTESDINYFINKLKNRENFSISRFNDGEWIFMLKIEPYASFWKEKKQHTEEIFDIASGLKGIILSKPNYYVSISTHHHEGNILDEHVKPILVGIPNIVGSGIFNLWSIMSGMEELIEECKKRKTIIVGPDFLCRFPSYDIHYKTPSKHIHYHYKDILKDLDKILNENYEKDMIIIYSCSFVAKYAVDEFYKKYGDTITQLDLGSSTSAMCLISNRPWHTGMIKYYTEKRLQQSDTYSIKIGGRGNITLCGERNGSKFCRNTVAYQKLTLKSDVKPYLQPNSFNRPPYITIQKVFITDCYTKK